MGLVGSAASGKGGFSKRIFLFEKGIVDTGTREKGKELMQTVYHADNSVLHIRRLAERRTDTTMTKSKDTADERDDYFPLKSLRPKKAFKQSRTKRKRRRVEDRAGFPKAPNWPCSSSPTSSWGEDKEKWKAYMTTPDNAYPLTPNVMNSMKRRKPKEIMVTIQGIYRLS